MYACSVIRSENPGDPLAQPLEDMVAEAMAQRDLAQGAAPDFLYHYTDVAGLIGILNSGSLWATNLRFMNDSRELDHARQLMIDVLHDARTRATAPGQRTVIDAIETNLTTLTGYPDFYSVSFSSDGDLLSQWRGYGSAGGGYAIGFDPDGLVCPEGGHPQTGRFLNRVVYDRDSQTAALSGVADTMLALFALS
jgi:hypothetical protein